METLLKRYSQGEQLVIKAFFAKLEKQTRKSGKVSENAKKKQLDKWQKYDTKTVIDGLKIYNSMNITAAQDEKYALGIIRNKAKELSTNASSKRGSSGQGEGDRIAKLAANYISKSEKDIECDF